MLLPHPLHAHTFAHVRALWSYALAAMPPCRHAAMPPCRMAHASLDTVMPRAMCDYLMTRALSDAVVPRALHPHHTMPISRARTYADITCAHVWEHAYVHTYGNTRMLDVDIMQYQHSMLILI